MTRAAARPASPTSLTSLSSQNHQLPGTFQDQVQITYAQRHADAGVAPDVLRDLMNHRNITATLGYYRIGEDRRREAVDRVAALQFDRHGNRIWRDVKTLLDAEHARYAIGEVAVPYGRCGEPSNVAAGGGACPIRFRCAGCDHFRTDVSYLPDLTAYLDDLLRSREHLAAVIDGVDDWARADATPSQEEITRIRRLINRIKGDLAELGATEQASRRRGDHRPAPAPRRQPRHARHPPRHARHPGNEGTPRDHQEPARRGNQEDRADARRTAGRLSTPTAARHHDPRPRRSRRRGNQHLRHRARRRSRPHLPLPAPRPARQNPRTRSRPRLLRRAGPAVTRTSLQADLLAAHERTTRLASRIRQLEQRLSGTLGEQAWRESGLGAPADIDALNHKIIGLEQQVTDLRMQLDERDQDLAAARAANRELMARLNTRDDDGVSSLHHSCRAR